MPKGDLEVEGSEQLYVRRRPPLCRLQDTSVWKLSASLRSPPTVLARGFIHFLGTDFRFCLLHGSGRGDEQKCFVCFSLSYVYVTVAVKLPYWVVAVSSSFRLCANLALTFLSYLKSFSYHLRGRLGEGCTPSAMMSKLKETEEKVFKIEGFTNPLRPYLAYKPLKKGTIALSTFTFPKGTLCQV